MWKNWYWGCLVILMIIVSCTNNNEKQESLITAKEQLLLQQWNAELDRLSKEVNLLERDLDKSTFLRNYCGSIADYGQPSQASDEYFHQQKWDSLSMAHVYNVFIENSMPSTCGPLSSFYCALLSHFNIPCAIYDHGLDIPGLSHVLALVEISTDDTTKIIMQDPHYAMLYVDNNGIPLDFHVLLSLIQSKSYDKIKIDKDAISTHIIFNEETIDIVQKEMQSDSCKYILNQLANNKTYITAANRTYEYMMNNPCSPYRSLIETGLINKGYPSNILHTLILNGEVIHIRKPSITLAAETNYLLNH